MIAQIGGVTGRRRKDGREDEIEVKAGFLPSLMAAKNARDYQQSQLGLQERGLDQAGRQAREALDLEEEQAAKAQKLSMAGLSSEMGMGFGNYLNEDAAKDSAGKDVVAEAAKGATGDAWKSEFGSGLEDEAGEGAKGFMTALGDKATDAAGWGKALGSKGSYVGMFNAPIGGELAKTVTGAKKGDWWTPAAGGAAVSMLTDAFVNPDADFYSAAMNAIGGGGIGGAFSLW